MVQTDILAFGAHPDDIELGCGGTLIAHQMIGHSIVMVDLTYGEMGSRGNKEIRIEEATAASKIIGAKSRMNMGFSDAFFTIDEKHIRELVRVIRHYKPRVVICNAVNDRHPDHGRASSLVSQACYYAGLDKIKSQWVGSYQATWRPHAVYHYVQFYDIKPDILFDISKVIDKKMEAIRAHTSQFYNPHSKEPQTLISQPAFLDNIMARASYYGQYIGAAYAEGFTTERTPGINNFFHLL